MGVRWLQLRERESSCRSFSHESICRLFQLINDSIFVLYFVVLYVCAFCFFFFVLLLDDTWFTYSTRGAGGVSQKIKTKKSGEIVYK